MLILAGVHRGNSGSDADCYRIVGCSCELSKRIARWPMSAVTGTQRQSIADRLGKIAPNSCATPCAAEFEANEIGSRSWTSAWLSQAGRPSIQITAYP